MSQALEQLLENAPSIPQEQMYQTIDTYATGTTQLYSFDPPGEFPKIVPTDTGVVIPHPTIPEVPDLHDSYKIDRYDNLYKGHTTVNLPGDGKIRIDHDE